MFRASSCPSSGATTTAVAASGLPSERGDSSAVGRGRAGRPALIFGNSACSLPGHYIDRDIWGRCLYTDTSLFDIK
jgi:hypothetical protein